MSRKETSIDPDNTDRILSELGQVIDEAEIVKYIVRITDEIHQLKLNNAAPYNIQLLSGQLTLLEDRLARLRSQRKQNI